MLRIATLAILAALLATCGQASAGVDLPEPWPESKLQFVMMGDDPLPSGEARTRLLHDRDEYILGEQIPMRLGLANVGDRPFIIDATGEGAAGSFGIATDATVSLSGQDADGKPLAHVDVTVVGYDGPVMTYLVQPGQVHWTDYSAAQQLRIEKPGRYTIRAWRSYGWKDASRDRPPQATTQFTVRAPTPEEAQKIVTALRNHPPEDYSVLRLPVYLLLLTDAALQGDHAALAGVASIETPEATAILLQALAQQLKRGDAPAAFPFLEPRLPRATPLPHPGRAEAPQDRLVQRTWNPQFAPQAQALLNQLGGRDDSANTFYIRSRLTAAAAPTTQPK